MKSIGISFGIGALVSATFSKSFGMANKGISQLSNTIGKLNQEIINLKDTQSLIAKYNKDNKALKEKIVTIKETEKAIKNLKKEIENEKKAIEENTGKTSKQRKEIRESKKIVEEKTKALKDLEKKLNSLNQSYIKEAKNLSTTRNILKEKKIDLNDTAKAYDKLEKSIKAAENATKKFTKASSVNNIANKFSSAGNKMLAGAGAVAGTLYKPVQEAINAESNFSDVKKQFDFNSKEEEEKFKKDLHKIITEKKIAISLNELYGAAASAGQSGLNQEEAVEYIELASKIGMAFDMNREEAAQAMFEMKNALKLPYEGLIELTDKMNYLGNTTGASAAKITDFVNRTGNIGKLAGFSADKVAAIGASLIEQGMDADVAATGAKKVFSAMTKGNAVTKSQAKIYKSLGIDPVELSKLAQEDAQKALNLLFTKINSKSKDEQGAIMTLLFGEEGKRGAAAIAANLDRVNENLAKVNGDEAKGSVDKEADIKRATTANQLAIANGKLSIILSQLGTTVLPSVNSALEWFSNFLSKISAYQEKHPELFKKIMDSLLKGVVVLGGLGIAFKGVAGTLKIYSNYLKIAGFMTKHQVGTNILKSGAKLFNFGKRLIKGVGTLSKAFVKFGATMLASPITWVIAGIIALVAAGYLLYKNWDTVKQKAIELKNMVVGLIDKFWYLMGPIGWIVKGGMEIYRNWDKIKAKAAELKEKVANMITNLVLKWDNFKASIKNILGNVFNWMEEKWNNIKDIGGKVADFFVGIFEKIKNGFDTVVGWGKKILSFGSNERTAPPGRRGYSTQSNITPYSYGDRNIPGYAKGGIVNSPTLAWIGEGASSESIIPHDSSERSFNLWEKTGRLIGAYEKTDNSSSFTFTYAPVINANDSKGVDEVIKKNQVDAFNEFKNMMKKYENEEKRRGRGR